MRLSVALPVLLIGSGAAIAGEEICRSLSARWSDQGAEVRTTLWESGAPSGKVICHKIEHVIVRAGAETTLTGTDCNCDLIADGQEAALAGAPHEATAARLKALCAEPVRLPAQAAGGYGH